METISTIHAFWFGSHADDAVTAQEQAKLWWRKNADTDERIRQRFSPWADKAANHELDAWLATPTGRLALILLTDQFPRNMYRNTPRAFAFDRLALAWSKEGIGRGDHQLLRPIERVFLYLPLEHSEAQEDQELAVTLFQQLVDSVEIAHKPVFAGFLDFAERHRAIIARFGRFPHRNQILGRESTLGELSFLKEKGSSF